MITKKYEMLEDDTIVHQGITLHRIIALRDISLKGVNKGDKGGYIQSYSNLSHDGTSWIGGDAKVYGKAYVCGAGLVTDNAEASGITTIIDSGKVTGNAKVMGHCYIGGNGKVMEDAYLDARVSILGDAVVRGDVKITIDWVQRHGEISRFNSNEVDAICDGIGGTYAAVGERLKVLQKRMGTVIKHLEGVKDYVEIVTSDIDGMNNENDCYAKMVDEIERTHLVIRNTKDKMFERIEDYSSSLCRTEKEKSIPVVSSEEEAPKEPIQAEEPAPVETPTPIEEPTPEEPIEPNEKETKKKAKSTTKAKSKADTKSTAKKGGRPKKSRIEKADAYAARLAKRREQRAIEKAQRLKEIEESMNNTNVRKNDK